MKITILDSILHGPLKPWLQKLGASDRFTQVLSKAVATTPVTYYQLQEQLEILLQDYPSLLKYLKEEEVSEPSIQLIEHFYEINIPQHSNSFKQFYYLVYLQEALRYFNALIIKVEVLQLQDDKDYQVAKALSAIKVLTIQVNDVLKDYETDLPENENIRYALTATRFILIVLFFEIQDFFSLTIEDPIQPKFFFQNYLHQPFEKDLLNRSPIYYENFIWKMSCNGTFQNDLARVFLQSIKDSHLKTNHWLLARYENAIFIFENGYSQDTVYKDFSAGSGAQIIKEKKQEWTLMMDKLDTGFKRLNFINELLDELEYVSDNRNNSKSIPSRLFRFLLQQKEIYTNHLTVSFQSDISLYQNQIIKIENPSLEREPVNTAQNHPSPQAVSSLETGSDEPPHSAPTLNEKKTPVFRFGFKERLNPSRVKALNDCIFALDQAINFLREDDDNLNELMKLLLSQKILPGKQRVDIGCETKQFKYIINKFEPYFHNFNPNAVGWSQSFYSKKDKPINAQNLYSSGGENPKQKAIIDNIFKQLQ